MKPNKRFNCVGLLYSSRKLRLREASARLRPSTQPTIRDFIISNHPYFILLQNTQFLLYRKPHFALKALEYGNNCSPEANLANY